MKGMCFDEAGLSCFTFYTPSFVLNKFGDKKFKIHALHVDGGISGCLCLKKGW